MERDQKLKLITAPFTLEQVKALNVYQYSGVWHEFTCGNSHPEASPILIAEEDGWHCPKCEYTQNWAHAFMADYRTILERKIMIGVIEYISGLNRSRNL